MFRAVLISLALVVGCSNDSSRTHSTDTVDDGSTAAADATASAGADAK